MDDDCSRPVIPLLISFIIGLSAGYLQPGFSWVSISAGICCVGLMARGIFRSGKTFLSPLVLFACIGYISIDGWTAPDFPGNHIVNFMDTHAWEISGEISDEPIKSENRYRFDLQVNSLSISSKAAFPVCGRIRVTVRGENITLCNGDRVRFSSKIRSFRNFLNPGAYNYKDRMAFNGIQGSAYVTADKLSIIEPAEKIPFRQTIRKLMEEAVNEPALGILKALILGESTGIGPELRDAVNRAGLGHLLAISGLHIGIVASFSFFIGRFLLSFCPFLIRRAWTRKSAAILALGPVLFYGWFSGMSPSTQRAVIMVSIFMMTFLVERDHDLYNTLALAALIILVIHPPALFQVSFQLSFTAVLAILAGVSRIPVRSSPEASKWAVWRKNLLTSTAVSLFATMGTLPLVMLYFNQVSLISPVANLIGIPLIGFMVTPLGLISTATAIFSHPAGQAGFWICGKILEISIFIIEWMASFDFSAVKTITPNWLEIAGFYILLFSAFHYRKSGSIKVIAAFVGLILALDVSYWIHRRYFSSALRITVLDVGQGFASLVEFPRGYTMMIDGGGFSDNAGFDVGARIVAPYLWRNKIKTVDTLVLSHPHSDHLNGLFYIADHFTVNRMWTNGNEAETMGYMKLTEMVALRKIEFPPFHEIKQDQTINGVSLKFLNPPENYASLPSFRHALPDDLSIVIKLGYGNTSFLFPGDIRRDAEEAISLDAGNTLKSDVLIAPHHGSKTSSSRLFVEKVCPEWVIIPAGFGNRFHFPHPSVLERLEKRGCRIYRTDLDGSVRLKSDGKTISFTPFITAADRMETTTSERVKAVVP